MDNKKVEYKDLSGWIKFAVVWTYIQVVSGIVGMILMLIAGVGLIVTSGLPR